MNQPQLGSHWLYKRPTTERSGAFIVVGAYQAPSRGETWPSHTVILVQSEKTGVVFKQDLGVWGTTMEPRQE